MRRRSILVFLLCTTFLRHSDVLSQWSTDPSVNNPLCTAPDYQFPQKITSDGAGGAIVAWVDARNGNSDIYAQRINAGGVVQWTTDGVALCVAANAQTDPAIISDGAGGAIVTWDDSRSGTRRDIYAQRINANGVVRWTTDGVAVCTANGQHFLPAIASDSAGGAIIAWQDLRGTSGYDVYVQRINPNGNAQWTANGVALCQALSDQDSPVITTDGAGGAIAAWVDYRSGTADIYARRITANGTLQWINAGIALCTATGIQENPVITSDGVGGAVVAWDDVRSGSTADHDIYAQWINASGVVQWATDGVAVCVAPYIQNSPAITGDGAGGVIITWYDGRDNIANHIYAQRVSAGGVAQWASNGVPVCRAGNGPYGQADPVIMSDGAGGAIVTWDDGGRNGPGDRDIYAQWINAGGVMQWTVDGVPLSTAPGDQYTPSITGDGSGGAIVAWTDYRTQGNDIYAQSVDRFGNLGTMAQSITTVTDIPNDQGGSVRVKWHKSTADTSLANNQIVSYGLWRRIPPSLSPRKVRTTPQGVMNDSLGSLYDFITSVPAVQSSQYNVVAPTLEDSSSSGSHATLFLVTAHTANPNQFYLSSVDSGHSVDNLSPLTPGGAHLTPLANAIRLQWNFDHNDPDVGHYAVYRSTTDGFPLADSTRWGTTADSLMVDSTISAGAAYYYRVTTVDIHGNESSPSAQLYSPNALSSKASVKVLLEGPYNIGTQLMNKTLRTDGFLAAHFGSIPIPTDAVDSINIELRNASSVSASTTRKFRPAWLLTDGSIRDFFDTTANCVTFDTLAGNYYLVITHRNHIAIMTSTTQALNGAVPALAYDFTIAQSQAYGSNPMKAVAGGRFAMIAGDASGNGQVATSDINTFIRPRLGQSGYQSADINLNGQIQTSDINTYARPNLGKGTQVPASPAENGKRKERL